MAVNFATVREVALKLPDVEEKTSTRGLSLTLNGRMFACVAIHKSAEPNSLMVRISRTARQALLEAEPDVYYITEHYVGYPSILVRLSQVDRKTLKAILEKASLFARET